MPGIFRSNGKWLASTLILIASLRIVATYKVLSHTTDEPAHLAAGLEWIENGTYTYEDQHPPLARVTGAIGLWLTGAKQTHNPDMYMEGFLLLGQQHRYTRALFFSRLMMLPFFWIASAVVYLWTRRIADEYAALAATFLFTTTPTVLAHAGLATTDMALTAFTGAAALASLIWAEKPGWKTSLIFGTLTGLAIASKFSSLVFLPAAWLLMYLLPGQKNIKRPLRWVPVSTITAAFVIWAVYRFEVGPVAFLHMSVPAPKFFTGVQSVIAHNQAGHLAYLLGKTSTTGFWYYYPIVTAVKTPLATLVLLVCAIAIAARKLALPLAFIAGVFAVGLFSHINIGVRHILPIYLGFAICGGVALATLARSARKPVIAAAAVLALWQFTTGAIVHPDYLAYTNEFAGSHPENILADSDLDWEQGTRALEERLVQLHAPSVTLKLNSTGYLIAGNQKFPRFSFAEDGDKPPAGWVAVAITPWKLSGQPAWASHYEPKERIRRSILLYYFPQ